MNKKRTLIALILTLVIVLTIPVGIYFYPMIFDKKPNNDDNGGKKPVVFETDVEYISYAVGKVCDEGYEILDTYAANADVAKVSDNSGDGEIILCASQVADESLSLDNLKNYFSALSTSLQIPVLLDYVLNSSNSQYYANSFEVGQTYFAREAVSNDNYHLYYFKADRVDGYINLYVSFKDELLICQVNYDFTKDELISARTMNANMFAEIDYKSNSLSVLYLPKSVGDIQTVLDGEYDYDDAISDEYNRLNADFCKGNITTNINNIEFQDIGLESNGADVLFNTFIKKFESDVDVDKIFDKSDVEINSSFIDAIDYSMRRLDYEIRKKNAWEYEYVTTWLGFDESIALMTALVKSSDFSSSEDIKTFVNVCKNKLNDRGELAYTGKVDFAIPNIDTGITAYLSVNKVNNELNAYNVIYIYDNEYIEFSCKYENGVITPKGDTYFGIEWNVKASTDGTYAIIEDVDTVKRVVDIPEEIEVNGTVLPVKELYNFYGYSSSGNIILNIPACVETISFNSTHYISEINVADGNNNYKSAEGVLFNKEMTILVCYPAAKTTESYTMPESVEFIERDVFSGLKNLKTLTVSKNLTKFDYNKHYETFGRYMGSLEARDFWTAFSLERVIVPAENSDYFSIDGVVYSKDKKTLIMCPMGRTGEFTIPSTVEVVGEYAFGYCKYLTKINIPTSVTIIEDVAFSGCESVKEIYIPESVVDIEFSAFENVKLAISDNHTKYSTDEKGIIYNKDMTILYYCPSTIKGEVIVANSVTEIADYAFAYNTGVTSVVMGENVTHIGERAFLYSSVQEVKILGDVYLGYEAFFRSELKVLNIHGISGCYGDELDWDTIGDCPIETINFGGTQEDWRAWESRYSFEEWYYGDITRLDVVCSDGIIKYTRTND